MPGAAVRGRSAVQRAGDLYGEGYDAFSACPTLVDSTGQCNTLISEVMREYWRSSGDTGGDPARVLGCGAFGDGGRRGGGVGRSVDHRRVAVVPARWRRDARVLPGRQVCGWCAPSVVPGARRDRMSVGGGRGGSCDCAGVGSLAVDGEPRAATRDCSPEVGVPGLGG